MQVAERPMGTGKSSCRARVGIERHSADTFGLRIAVGDDGVMAGSRTFFFFCGVAVRTCTKASGPGGSFSPLENWPELKSSPDNWTSEALFPAAKSAIDT